MRGDRSRARQLRQPTSRAHSRALRQRIEGEEPAFDDLAIRFTRRGLMRILHEIEHHMIAPRSREVEIDAQKHRLRDKPEISLFAEFGLKRSAGGLARLDTPSRQVPSRHIGMAHEKDAPRLVAYDRAHAQRHAPREPEPQMGHAQQQPMTQAQMISFAFTP